MKVLQINSVCGVGSTGNIVKNLYLKLQDNGVDCKIGYGRCNKSTIPTADLFKIGNTWDFYKHALSSRLIDNSGFGSKCATVKFIKEVEKYSPDIIHLHNIHGYYLNVKILFDFIKNANIPVVWTLHDCWAFTGHCAYFDYINCNKWKTQCYSCQQKRQYPKSILFDNSRYNYNIKKKCFLGVENMKIITPSCWLKKEVSDSYLSTYDIRVIHNGIDTNIFKPVISDIRDKFKIGNKKIILSVAYVWDRRKGLNDIIKLSYLLPKDKYQIVIIGLTDEQLNKIPNWVIGLTRTRTQKELVEWYSAADVFVNCSYEDNYPTVNLEAQSCGTPVIGYNTGGSIESIIKQNVIEKGDIEGLSDLIKNACYTNDIKKEIFYDENISFDLYLKLYSDIFGKRYK